MSNGGKGFKASENLNSAKSIAKEVGFGSADTYYKAKFIYENADDDTLDNLDEGKATINRVYKKLKAKDNPKEKSTSNQSMEHDVKEGYHKSIVNENSDLKLKIKQLERENNNLKFKYDNDVKYYKQMYENEKNICEIYKSIAKGGTTGSARLDKTEYRKLCKVCHPDNGGSEELMSIISKLYQK